MEDVVRADKGEEIGYTARPAPHLYHEREYVIRTWLEHKLHHNYPESGSYNDQDAYLMLDWHTMNLYYTRVSHGDFHALFIPTDAAPWEDLAGE